MSGMIRRLRWKIVGISMLFVTLVLAAVFTGVMLTARSSLEQSSTRQLEEALRGEGYDGQNGQPCFVTEVYPSGTVRVMGSSYYQISEEDLLALVQECLSQQEESGLLTDYHLRYLRYDGALSIRIAFTDSTLEQSALRAMAGNLLLIALAALVVLLGCSYLLSGVAARPVERAWQEQQRFLSDASHELKTPLTVILSSADLLAESAPAEEQTYVENIRAESRRMKKLVEEMLTNCVLGGILVGFSLGIVLTCGCSTGGLDVVGLCLTKRGSRFTVGRFSLGFNIVLYIACALLFDIQTAIYSVIYTVFCSLFIDRGHQQNINVQVLIFTRDADPELPRSIMSRLGRGVTYWEGKGAYTESDMRVLCVCVSKFEVAELQETVRELDPHAFFIVQEGVRIGGNFLRKIS